MFELVISFTLVHHRATASQTFIIDPIHDMKNGCRLQKRSGKPLKGPYTHGYEKKKSFDTIVFRLQKRSGVHAKMTLNTHNEADYFFFGCNGGLVRPSLSTALPERTLCYHAATHSNIRLLLQKVKILQKKSLAAGL